MGLDLRGKRAVVTGGSRGIGRAIAERLVAAGAAVVICGKDASRVERAVEELSARGKAAGIAADVSRQEDVENLFRFADETQGGLDILINNAGVGGFAAVADLEPRMWHEVIGTNLTGAYYCARQAARRMKAQGGGWIVMISSLAQKNPFAGGAAYNASKFALGAFSEALMLDHRHDGVRVCSILPGSVNTDFGHTGNADWKIAPEDVAEVVAMVLSMPERSLISQVELRPSRPPKK